jgi:hypothetical protein
MRLSESPLFIVVEGVQFQPFANSLEAFANNFASDMFHS